MLTQDGLMRIFYWFEQNEKKYIFFLFCRIHNSDEIIVICYFIINAPEQGSIWKRL
jgi:hypothetical protein